MWGEGCLTEQLPYEGKFYWGWGGGVTGYCKEPSCFAFVDLQN